MYDEISRAVPKEFRGKTEQVCVKTRSAYYTLPLTPCAVMPLFTLQWARDTG